MTKTNPLLFVPAEPSKTDKRKVKENSGLQCLVCLSKTVPIESIIIIRTFQMRGEIKKTSLYISSQARVD